MLLFFLGLHKIIFGICNCVFMHLNALNKTAVIKTLSSYDYSAVS